MKKLLKFLFTLIILAAIGYAVWHFFGDKIKSLFDNAEEILANKATIVVKCYYEDANTNDYTSNESSIKVEENKEYIHTPEAKEHYHINNELSKLTTSSAKNGDVISVYYDLDLVEITYVSDKIKTGEPTKFSFKYGKDVTIDDFPEYENPGYIPENVTFKATETKTIEVSWKIRVNTLTIYLPEGASISDLSFEELSPNVYLKTFTYFDTITLPTPTFGERLFIKYQDDDENEYTVLSNIETDLALDAIFEGCRIEFICVYDEAGNLSSEVYPTIVKEVGEKIYPPKISSENQRPGYGLTWYTSTNEPYVFDYMPDNNIELIGKWELDTGVSFLQDIGPTIDNLDELVAAYDFVYFNYDDVGTSWNVSNTYVSSIEKLQQQFHLIQENCLSQYHGNGQIGASFSQTGDDIKIALKLDANRMATEGSITAPANAYTHYAFSGDISHEAYRSTSFNDFYIEKLTNTYEVETSNQLLFVVEHGYKPICKADSKALVVYNKAKEILRQIVSDEMTDFEKAEAIYDYLVMNIQYDHVVADTDDDDWSKYDAYFIEGALLNKKAVCDGIAKSYSLLCNMEGIPCVEVTGNKHAWCKVKVNNIWYVVDATHGNTQLPPSMSVMTHEHFLTSDLTKKSRGYETIDYANIKCNKDFNYYEYKEIEVNGTKMNLYVKSINDLVNLLKYCDENHSSINNMSLEFFYDMDDVFSTVYFNAKSLSGVTLSDSYLATNDAQHSVVNLIIK